LGRRRDGSPLAGLDDGSGDGLRTGFLTVIPKDPHEVLEGPLVHDPLGRLGIPGVHPHVEGALLVETETPTRVLELVHADAQVDQDGIDEAQGGIRQGDLQDVSKVLMHVSHPIAPSGEPLAGSLEGFGVPVDGDEATRSGLEEGLGVAARTHGGVDDDRAFSQEGTQVIDDLFP